MQRLCNPFVVADGAEVVSLARAAPFLWIRVLSAGERGAVGGGVASVWRRGSRG